jgi:hypothetical protein
LTRAALRNVRTASPVCWSPCMARRGRAAPAAHPAAPRHPAGLSALERTRSTPGSPS